MPCLEPNLNDKRYCIGYASGSFDGFHIGHLRYLQQAAEQCEQLIVGIPTDAIVKANKSSSPSMTCAERMEIISAIRCVSRVIKAEVGMVETKAFAEFLQQLKVDAIFVGEDWQDTPRWQRLKPVLLGQNIAVHFLPRTTGISSTLLKQR